MSESQLDKAALAITVALGVPVILCLHFFGLLV